MVENRIATRKREDSSSQGELCTPLPSEAEQRAIVAFLDRETAQIEALVAKIREAIDRL